MPTAEQVMTRGVILIGEDDSVAEAMKVMTERHVTSLIVEKSCEADVHGIVTRKDIINKVIATGEDPRKMKVAEIMSKPLMSIDKKMDVIYVARLMAKTGVRRFPVMEGNKMIGIIANSDIFKAYAIDNIIGKGSKKK